MARTTSKLQSNDDLWTIIRLASGQSPATFALPEAGGLFPLSLWSARKQEIIARYKHFGIWLDGSDDIEAVAADLHYFRVIAFSVPDGGVQAAVRLLRDRCRYDGELRIVCDDGESTQALRRAAPLQLIAVNANLQTVVARQIQSAAAPPSLRLVHSRMARQ